MMLGDDLADYVAELRRSRRIAAERHRRAVERRDTRTATRTRRELERLTDALLWASWDQPDV